MKMIGILKSAEKSKAPADFINRLHQRIENDSLLNRLKRFFQIPKHIQYPLDIIALGTRAILVFTVFSMLQTPDHDSITDLSKDNMLTRSEDRHQGTTPDNNSDSLSNIFSLDSKQTDNIKSEPIQMALFLKTGDPAIAVNTTQQEETNTYNTDRPVTIDKNNLYRVDSGMNNTNQNALESILSPRIYDRTRSDTEDLLSELLNPSLTEALQHAVINKAVTDIETILLKEGGKIMSFETHTETGQPEFINIQIPRSDYDLFVQRIGGIGKLEISRLSESHEDKSVRHLRIQLIPPG
jgi:hypothetical protein